MATGSVLGPSSVCTPRPGSRSVYRHRASQPRPMSMARGGRSGLTPSAQEAADLSSQQPVGTAKNQGKHYPSQANWQRPLRCARVKKLRSCHLRVSWWWRAGSRPIATSESLRHIVSKMLAQHFVFLPEGVARTIGFSRLFWLRCAQVRLILSFRLLAFSFLLLISQKGGLPIRLLLAIPAIRTKVAKLAV